MEQTNIALATLYQITSSSISLSLNQQHHRGKNRWDNTIKSNLALVIV